METPVHLSDAYTRMCQDMNAHPTMLQVDFFMEQTDVCRRLYIVDYPALTRIYAQLVAVINQESRTVQQIYNAEHAPLTLLHMLSQKNRSILETNSLLFQLALFFAQQEQNLPAQIAKVGGTTRKRLEGLRAFHTSVFTAINIQLSLSELTDRDAAQYFLSEFFLKNSPTERPGDEYPRRQNIRNMVILAWLGDARGHYKSERSLSGVFAQLYDKSKSAQLKPLQDELYMAAQRLEDVDQANFLPCVINIMSQWANQIVFNRAISKSATIPPERLLELDARNELYQKALRILATQRVLRTVPVLA